MNRHEVAFQPTDTMHRRTPLSFSGKFLWLEETVTICTDSPVILRAAEEIGLVPLKEPDQQSAMRWDLVSEPTGAAGIEDWDCKVTVDQHSLYLTMGPRQWFAFDLETGEGAGFVVITDVAGRSDPNGVLYLLSLVYNVGACLRPRLLRSC
jgi:hypothetical protein